MVDGNGDKFSNKSAFSEIRKLFTYGQDSVMSLDLTHLDRPTIKLNTIWEDQTEAFFYLKQDESIDDSFKIREEGKYIHISDTHEIEDVYGRRILFNLPEYSNFKANLRSGSILQESSSLIDAKIKGDFTLIHSSCYNEDQLVFQRVKSEQVEIDINRADLIFKKYLQLKRGSIIKRDLGKMEFKMLGVSERLDLKIKHTSFDAKNVYTNEISSEESINLSIDSSDSRGFIGIFNGSIELNSVSSYWKVTEAQFGYANISAKDSSIDMYVREVGNKLSVISDNSRIIIKTTKDLVGPMKRSLETGQEFILDGKIFDLKSTNHGVIEVIESNPSDNLFSYLTEKYQSKVKGSN